MLGEEILRVVEAIHRDKKIDREIIFHDIEMALLTATRKKYGTSDDITIHLNRDNGEIEAYKGDERIDPAEFGRIAAQTAKQAMIQRLREAERNVVFSNYEDRVGEMVTATIQRFEGPNIIVNLGNCEGIIPKREQIRDETYRPGDRIKCIITEVKKIGQKVRIVLSRTHPDFVKRLFELEVPEIAEHAIQIRALVREPGFRTKIAVTSIDQKVDCVGACVGVRGTRIKNIVDELNGEKIDIVRWNDSIEVLITNALRPAEIDSITLNYDEKKAAINVPKDQLSLAIGKMGQNVRLASKLTGWELDIIGLEGTSEGDKGTGKAAAEALFGKDSDGPSVREPKVTAANLFKDDTDGDSGSN